MVEKTSRFGAMLRLYRAVHDVTQHTTAKEIGISQGTLNRIEHGYSFDVTTLLKLWTWLLARKEKTDG